MPQDNVVLTAVINFNPLFADGLLRCCVRDELGPVQAAIPRRGQGLLLRGGLRQHRNGLNDHLHRRHAYQVRLGE